MGPPNHAVALDPPSPKTRCWVDSRLCNVDPGPRGRLGLGLTLVDPGSFRGDSVRRSRVDPRSIWDQSSRVDIRPIKGRSGAEVGSSWRRFGAESKSIMD